MSEAVNSSQRTAKNRRCPICGGAAGDQRGRSRRCYGFTSSDSKYVHCTREEHAGALKLIENSNTYAHRIGGKCDCGTTHGTDENSWSNIEVAYDYRDERGTLLYQVVRKIPKDFLQRRPDGAGGWVWSIGDTRRVLYRLPQLLSAPVDQFVFIVEGEKDVERLRERSIATCNPGGARKWNLVDDCAAKALRGRHLVIIADADRDGRAHAEIVKEWAKSVAATIRVIDLYPDRDDGRDISDWLDEQHTIDELKQIAEGTEAIETGIEADPWPQELARALEDVQRAIGEHHIHERRPLFGLDAVELLRMEMPSAQWQITGLITKNGTAVVAGEPKAGIKTWVLLEGAIAVATGSKVFGEFYAEQGNVAIFFAEDKAQAVRNRLRALLSGGNRTIPEGRLFLQPRGEFIDILKDEDLAWIVASARRLPKLDLLVLDPLRDIHSAAEDKSDEMSPVMKRLRLLGELLGCTVWISHHTPKATKDTSKRRAGQNMRGSSAIHGSIDSGIYVEPLEGDGVNSFRASVTSQIKDARSAGTFDVELAITDDESGAAISASWSFGKVNLAEDDAVVDWIERLNTPLSITALRKRGDRPNTDNGKPISERRMTTILTRLVRDQRIVVRMGSVLPRPTQLDMGVDQ
jgi:5S rRNA maturation endonuclease (ribonuclease M5)